MRQHAAKLAQCCGSMRDKGTNFLDTTQGTDCNYDQDTWGTVLYYFCFEAL